MDWPAWDLLCFDGENHGLFRHWEVGGQKLCDRAMVTVLPLGPETTEVFTNELEVGSAAVRSRGNIYLPVKWGSPSSSPSTWELSAGWTVSSWPTATENRGSFSLCQQRQRKGASLRGQGAEHEDSYIRACGRGSKNEAEETLRCHWGVLGPWLGPESHTDVALM